jgi:hypothetical protein
MSAFQVRARRQVRFLASPLVRLAPERYPASEEGAPAHG